MCCKSINKKGLDETEGRAIAKFCPDSYRELPE
jgi:hypothetical protein